MTDVRAKFEAIWPVPKGVTWSMNIGAYVCNDAIRITQELINKCSEWDARLDTFTRCQEMMESVEAERDQLKAKLAELEAIGALINSQDNRHTDQPMFAVMEKRGMVTLDTHDHDRIEWYDPVNVSTADDRTASRLEALHRGGRDVKDWERYAIKDVDVFVTACFTEQGCKDFLAIDGHNHREPFIYAFGSFRNSEYQSMRNWLKSLPKKTGD